MSKTKIKLSPADTKKAMAAVGELALLQSRHADLQTQHDLYKRLAQEHKTGMLEEARKFLHAHGEVERLRDALAAALAAINQDIHKVIDKRKPGGLPGLMAGVGILAAEAQAAVNRDADWRARPKPDKPVPSDISMYPGILEKLRDARGALRHIANDFHVEGNTAAENMQTVARSSLWRTHRDAPVTSDNGDA